MIGLDINVVIRYLVQDDATQARKANRLIEKSLTPEEPGFINLTTLSEIAWVLKSNYRLDKPGLVAIVEGLLTTKQLLVEDMSVAWKALWACEFRAMDFSDAVIAYANKFHECDYTVTFDKHASRLDDMHLL